jgi:thiol:disulfide interchange protein DsbD
MSAAVIASTLTLLGLGIFGKAAPAAHSEPPAKLHARPALICDRAALEPGKTAHLGVHFQIDPGWHLYWNGLNDSGMPIDIQVTLPPGYTAGPLQWPAPIRHVADGDLLDHIYEGSVTLILAVKVPTDAKGDANFTAKLSWLVCKEACIAEKADVSLKAPVGRSGLLSTATREEDRHFESARLRMPKPLPTGPDAPKVMWAGSVITIDAPGAKGLSFFPDADCVPLADLLRSSSAPRPSLELQAEPQDSVQPRLKGVLEVRRDAPIASWYRIDIKNGTPTHTQPPPKPRPAP